MNVSATFRIQLGTRRIVIFKVADEQIKHSCVPDCPTFPYDTSGWMHGYFENHKKQQHIYALLTKIIYFNNLVV